MAEYRAPVADMRFTLKHAAGLQQLAKLPQFEDASDDMVTAILEEAGRIAGEVLSPLNVSGDQQGLQQHDTDVQTPDGFREAYQAFIEGGWGSLQFDPEHGGQGMPYVLSIAVMEMWQAANMSWGLCPLLTQGAVEALASSASDELQQTYLPKLISGEWTGTMNLTEPAAGSDLSVIRTKAVPNGDHYLISGQKIFITWGEHDMAENIVHLVLARLPDAPPGVKGISLFLVPKFLPDTAGNPASRNDCQVVSLEHKLGIHASPTCVMSYGDNGGAVGYLVGAENQGLACMFKMMNNARLAVGLQGVAIAERAYQHAVEFARERVQGRAVGFDQAGPIIRHADVQRMLLTMRALTEAGRALTYDACASIDWASQNQHEDLQQTHGARAALLTPVVKGWCTELAQEVTSLGVQVHGGMGFIEETGAAQYYRDARILPIYEGTNGIQAMDLVGRKLIFDNAAAFNVLMAEIRADIGSAEAAGLAVQAEALQAAVQCWEGSAEFILQQQAGDPLLAGAVGQHFLMLSGYVCGGWQLLRQAVACQSEADISPQYRAGKQKVCDFYLQQILPRIHGHAETLQKGSAAVTAMSEEEWLSSIG
ncbi:acyl-CoA dehydrogenase [Aliamphritea spongicola]|uniref:acyl-CoA dehydrogenase n=1 Tax=Aliamphritea spongicola TaxID=707589 RepID=UPI00196B3562|nr:acyl-CoA dehydrogenase [Aliamphritea spongicola]MBN3561510.1 acyl-CoA dehydrogenase [Aliamphritea spongicola]